MAQDFDYTSGPKKVYVDGFSVQVVGGITHVVFQSGGKPYVFVIPLPGAKGLGRALVKQVEAIEKQTGATFDISLSDESQPSPMNMEKPPQ